MRKIFVYMLAFWAIWPVNALVFTVSEKGFDINGDHFALSGGGLSFSLGPFVYGNIDEGSLFSFMDDPWQRKTGLLSEAVPGLGGKERAVSWKSGKWSVLTVPGEEREFSVSFRDRYFSSSLGYRRRERKTDEIIVDWERVSGEDVLALGLSAGYMEYVRLTDTVTFSPVLGLRNLVRLDAGYGPVGMTFVYGDILSSAGRWKWGWKIGLEDETLLLRWRRRFSQRTKWSGRFTSFSADLEWKIVIGDFSIGSKESVVFDTHARRRAERRLDLKYGNVSLALDDRLRKHMRIKGKILTIGSDENGPFVKVPMVGNRLILALENGKLSLELRLEIPHEAE